MSNTDQEARQIVAQLDECQRAAIFRAIVDSQPRTFVPPPPAVRQQTLPARRPPTLVEIIRGVECCDASVVSWWARYRQVVGVLVVTTLFAATVCLSTDFRAALKILYGVALVAAMIVTATYLVARSTSRGICRK